MGHRAASTRLIDVHLGEDSVWQNAKRENFVGARRNLDKVPPDHGDAKYSGPASEKFWRRVNRIKDRRARSMCYQLGCCIQDIEYRLLQAIELAEKPHKD